MLVSFSTRSGHLLMQDEPALALLRLGGHSGAVPGAILTADLPAFMTQLQAGLAIHGEEFCPAPPAADTTGQDEDAGEPGRERPVRLRLRAVPLLEMIETAVRQSSDLMWESA